MWAACRQRGSRGCPGAFWPACARTAPRSPSSASHSPALACTGRGLGPASLPPAPPSAHPERLREPGHDPREHGRGTHPTRHHPNVLVSATPLPQCQGPALTRAPGIPATQPERRYLPGDTPLPWFDGGEGGVPQRVKRLRWRGEHQLATLSGHEEHSEEHGPPPPRGQPPDTLPRVQDPEPGFPGAQLPAGAGQKTARSHVQAPCLWLQPSASKPAADPQSPGSLSTAQILGPRAPTRIHSSTRDGRTPAPH